MIMVLNDIFWFFLGSFIGVTMMCMLAVSRDDTKD
jgi:hypothetical protein